MNIQNVTVCGLGLLGEQIAFQIAFNSKFKVVVYDHDQKVLENAKAKLLSLGKAYKKNSIYTQQEIELTINSISYAFNLQEATKNADLVIETITEDLQIKKDFYKILGETAPAKSIFCTNSSILLPSVLASETGRPERFLALHFILNTWKRNIVEIMGHADTDPKIFDELIAFAKELDMVALPVYKENEGYVVNTLLVPFLRAAQSLYINKIADFQTIDKSWMITTRSPIGPFGLLDIIGIKTAYNLNKLAADAGDRNSKKMIRSLQKNFIDQNKLGVATREGFYTYPNPIFQSPDFLKSGAVCTQGLNLNSIPNLTMET